MAHATVFVKRPRPEEKGGAAMTTEILLPFPGYARQTNRSCMIQNRKPPLDPLTNCLTPIG